MNLPYVVGEYATVAVHEERRCRDLIRRAEPVEEQPRRPGERRHFVLPRRNSSARLVSVVVGLEGHRRRLIPYLVRRHRVHHTFRAVALHGGARSLQTSGDPRHPSVEGCDGRGVVIPARDADESCRPRSPRQGREPVLCAGAVPTCVTVPDSTNESAETKSVAAMRSAIFRSGISACRGVPALSPKPLKSKVNAA